MNFSVEIIMEIRAGLDIEWLPLFESELPGFRKKLFQWNDLISQRNIEEAREMQLKLSDIKFIPDEKNLNVFYKLFETRLLLGENKLDSAKEMLETVETNLHELDDLQLHYYYNNKGTWNYKNTHYNDAINFYLKANELRHGLGNDISLYYNIGISYKRLGMLACATSFLEKARKLYSSNQNIATIPAFHVDRFLAAIYIALGQLHWAKELLDGCYEKAKLDNDIELINSILPTYGYMYRRGKCYDTAIEYLDKSLNYLDNSDELYLEALYQKILCLIETKRSTLCPPLLKEGKELSEGKETYTIMFNTLEYLTMLNTPGATEYVEEAIKYMEKNKLNHIAIEYCYFLKQHYKTKLSRDKTSAMRIGYMASDFYEEMLVGGIA